MARSVQLNVLPLRVAEQRYTCHSCAGCCRDFTVQLRDADVEKLDRQGWAERLGDAPYVEFRGRRYLRQRDDGACVFLQDDGLCRVHAEFGFTEKPIACQLFPFTLMPAAEGVQMGLSYACPSVIHSRGGELAAHLGDVRRLARAIPEAKSSDKPPRLRDGLELRPADARTFVEAVDGWLSRAEIGIQARLEGLTLLAAALREDEVGGIVAAGKLTTLLTRLIDALPAEYEGHPAETPTGRQSRQLRQLVFAHVEDPRIPGLQGRLAVRRRALRQLWINHRFSRGRGAVPMPIGAGWPEGLRFEDAERIAPAMADHVAWVDSLLTRYVRTRWLGGRVYGPGYYGFSILDGLDALGLMIAATGYLARLHASGLGRAAVEPDDLEAALMRTDRAAGRAPWLGSTAEKLRLKYLTRDHGVRNLLHAWRLVDPPDGPGR